MYNFNEAVDRHNTKSVKYEEMDLNFGTKDLLPFWIADMELKSPDFMIDALVKRARHGVFGYTKRMPDYYAAVSHWLKTRHSLEARPEHIEYAPGVVFALNMMIRMFTSPGDKIIIQTPVYYPFFNIIRGNGRVISENPLILENGRYRMDFADLREKVRDERCKMLILCSPHNPVGRVWTEEELRELGEICLANHVLVVSDEIHFDIVFKGHKHIPFASLSEEFRQNSVTCTAPSKTFNIAGLHSAYVLMYDPAKMERYKKELSLLDLNRSNVFSQEVTQVAYEQGAAWVDELLEHIEGNMDYVYGFLLQNIPGITPFKMEGTYLMWLDCRQLASNASEIEQLFIGKAGLALDGGYWFGEPGKGFMRINLACPRAMLEQAMQKLLILKK
jgi:cystathionine beta-lyase